MTRAAAVLLLVMGPLTLSSTFEASAQAPGQRLPPVQTQMPVGTAPKFDVQADRALASMRRKAEELKIGGAAMVASFDGDTIKAWSSKMVVVGRVKDPQTATEKGNNLLAIVYAKAAEMADTLQNSGSKVRPPMTGEFGWEGGVIAKTKTGYVIAAFSGGKSEDDVAVSRVGLAELKGEDQAESVKR